MRTLGRLLIEVRKQDLELDELKYMLRAKYYPIFIDAVNVLAEFDPRKKEFEKPSVATDIGTLMRLCVIVMKDECAMAEDDVLLKWVTSFSDTFESSYFARVNKLISEKANREKRNAESQLPDNEDIEKLTEHLERIAKEDYLKLSEGFCLETWKRLLKSTLSLVHTFTRRRAGETERMEINDFLTYKLQNNLIENPTEEEKMILESHIRFEVRGKKDRIVPVILHRNHVDYINLILKYRDEAGVPCDNSYIFGLPSAEGLVEKKHERACATLRQFRTQVDVKEPSKLRGTNLRKHMATECRKLNYNDNQRKDLANYMGHELDIHDKHYRKTVAAKEILQVGSILNNLKKGKLTPNSNKPTSTVVSGALDKMPSFDVHAGETSPMNSAQLTVGVGNAGQDRKRKRQETKGKNFSFCQNFFLKKFEIKLKL